MGIQVSDERTDKYVGTFHYGSADDMLQLEELRGIVKHLNKWLREGGYDKQYYVKLQGRLGENNPNAWKYRKMRNANGFNRELMGSIYREARYHGWVGKAQCIKLADADHADAYIYMRRT